VGRAGAALELGDDVVELEVVEVDPGAGAAGVEVGPVDASGCAAVGAGCGDGLSGDAAGSECDFSADGLGDRGLDEMASVVALVGRLAHSPSFAGVRPRNHGVTSTAWAALVLSSQRTEHGCESAGHHTVVDARQCSVLLSWLFGVGVALVGACGAAAERAEVAGGGGHAMPPRSRTGSMGFVMRALMRGR